MVFVNRLSTFQPPIAFMNYIFSVVVVVLLTAGRAAAQTAAADPIPVAGHDSVSLALRDLIVAEKDKKILLRWKADSLPSAENFYAVERSSNGIDFNMVGVIKTTNSGWIEFSDDSPPKGKIFYRVKFSASQASYYSEMIAATSSSADISCKFYPNPMDKVLIVRSEAGVDVQISDQSGKPLITDKFPGGIKIIDVSALEPGVYVITLFQKETGRQLTEKLVKK